LNGHPTPRQRALIGLCFFLSGLSALVYEVLWVRQFELVFGASAYAVGAVLTAFMGGLCLGGWVGGRISDRLPNPLRVYGALEIAIGLYAFAFPFLHQGLQGAYLSWAMGGDPPGFGSLMLRFLAAVLLLAPPTALMGATLPLLARVVKDEGEGRDQRIGRLYGLNLMGAVVGTVLAGFLLLPSLGQSTTLHFAAIVNLGLGALALGLSRTLPLPEEGSLPEGPVLVMVPSIRLALFLTALSGFAAMVYQVGFTRLLVMTLGGSVYAFSTMLSVFLAGLGAGALAVSRGRALREEGLPVRFAWVLGLTGLIALLTGALIDRLPYFFLWLYTGASHLGWAAAEGQRPIQFIISALVLSPLAVGLGASFPMVVAMGKVHLGATGNWVGKAYAWNTLGAILGSFLGAFLLLPALGIQRTLGLGVLAQLGACAFLVWRSLERNPLRWVPPAAWGVLGLLLYFLPGWDQHRLAMGPYDNLRYVKVEKLKDLQHGADVRKMLVDRRVGSMDLLYYKEGVASTVSVERGFMNQHLILFNNGKPEASTQTDLATQQLIAHIPLLWFEASRGRPAKEVGMVGLASGISAGAALRHGLERLAVVEIEPSMPRAAGIFKEFNFDVLSDPRFKFLADDGRHYFGTRPGAFDGIISEPSNPWIAGVANLFTREAFETGRKALGEGGVFCQWVQAYNMDLGGLKTIVRTFRSVFPQAFLFGVPPPPGGTEPGPDLILVGSMEPLQPSLKELERIMGEERLKTALKRIGIHRAEDLVGLLRMGPEEMDRFTGEGPLNTDDNCLIEYSAPHWFYRDTRQENLAEVERFRTDPGQWVRKGTARMDPIR